ncbi:hypothetical protein SAMN05421493_10272 [Pseudobutyrivibrio sp. 49]|uniref:hypothetical protein n=1 Tax=Pseudobutyrivibrio sp. 49 TaxID=1855344 RepID=UPI00087F37B0|nr:hypothetical protein [Pseudobutyrivibrio sp. 49]SDH59448.1 hypothetical protein SAMN05421493_10272 [Pseudobutyrivibrio sp. 49]
MDSKKIAKHIFILILCFIVAFVCEYIAANYRYSRQNESQNSSVRFYLEDMSFSGVNVAGNIVTTIDSDPQLFIDFDRTYIENIAINQIVGVGKEWNLQVYYVDGDEQFSDESSITQPINGEESYTTLEIGRYASRIRIDLGDEVGNIFNIYDIIINPESDVASLKDCFSFITAFIWAVLLFLISKSVFVVFSNVKKKTCSVMCLDKFFWFSLVIGCFIFSIVWLIVNGNGTQKYTDLVYEFTSQTNTNKSPERTLLYVLILVGIVAVSVYYLWVRNKLVNGSSLSDKILGKNGVLLLSFVVLTAVGFLWRADVSTILIIAGVLVVFVHVINAENVLRSLCLYVLLVYAEIALYRIYVFTGGRQNINSLILEIIAGLIVVAINIFKYSIRNINIVASFVQLWIPFSLLIFLQNQYYRNYEYITINVPRRVTAFVCVVIVLMLLEAVLLCWKARRTSYEGLTISIGSLVTIFTLNVFTEKGAVMPTDLHHSFEDVIGFSQIFEKGLIPYKDYIAASGFYSVVNGAFFKLFGKGIVSNLNISNQIFLLCVAVLLVITMVGHVKREYILLIATVFSICTYTRTLFIAPIVLILVSDRLIENKNLWLKVWILTSLFHGLYYPLYGAGVCIGFMPLAIWQIYSYWKNGTFKSDVKRKSFWIWWSVTLLPVVASIKLLWNTLLHIRYMSSITIYADGMVKFAQQVPEGVLDYLTDYPGLRMTIYIASAFVVPALFVVICYAFVLKAGKFGKNNTDFFKACIMAVLPIILIVGYSYTIVKLQQGSLFNRNRFLMLPVCILLIVFAIKYLEGKAKITAICIAVVIPAMWGGIAMDNIDTSCNAYITVPDGYMYITNDRLGKWGTGFEYRDIYNLVSQNYDSVKNDPEDTTYLGSFPVYGYYYICDVTPVSYIEYGPAVKGYDATKECIDVLKRNPSIVGGTGDIYYSPYYALSNYYLYHWLMTSGEYVWSPERAVFIPNTNGLSVDEVQQINKSISTVPDDFDIGLHPNSFGESLDSLEFILTELDAKYGSEIDDGNLVLSFDRTIFGDQADYIYLDFEDITDGEYYSYYSGDEVGEIKSIFQQMLLKRKYNKGMAVVVEWQDDNQEPHRMRCEMNEGKLLIPLGSGAKWLLHSHDNLSIWVEQDGEKIAEPLESLSEIRLLKLREVE